MSSPGVAFNLTCGKGVTELQNPTNLRLSSFAESHHLQQNNFDVSLRNRESGLLHEEPSKQETHYSRLKLDLSEKLEGDMQRQF